MTLSYGSVQNILQLNNVRFEHNVKAMCITFQCYIHSTGRPNTIVVVQGSVTTVLLKI